MDTPRSTRPLWSPPPEPPAPAHRVGPGTAHHDAIVIGAGVAGLWTATMLADLGLDVAVVEARRVGDGVSAASTAKVSSLHGLTYRNLERSRGAEVARGYGRANQWAIGEYERLIDRFALDCGWARLPAFAYTTEPERAWRIAEEADAAARAGLPAELVPTVPLAFPVAAAVRCDDQAMLDPFRFLTGLADALGDAGVTIHEESRVVAVDEGDPHVVHTDTGRLSAASVVVATQLPVYDHGPFFARTEPIRSYCLAATLSSPAPDVLAISVDDPTRSIRPVEPGGRQVVFGGNSHRVGEGGDTRELLAELEHWVRRHHDVVSIDARWSAQDYLSADGTPFLGRMPVSATGVYVATGFRKWGFSTAAVAGRIIANLVSGEESPWLDTFDATRSAVSLAAAGDLVTANASVGAHFLGDRLAAVHPAGTDTLAPGEGGIRRHDGRTVAAHRDDEGRLHLVASRCTHLGCVVAWNPAERSWDCPCHGARFDVDGEILNGPAVRPLGRHEP